MENEGDEDGRPGSVTPESGPNEDIVMIETRVEKVTVKNRVLGGHQGLK